MEQMTCSKCGQPCEMEVFEGNWYPDQVAELSLCCGQPVNPRPPQPTDQDIARQLYEALMIWHSHGPQGQEPADCDGRAALRAYEAKYGGV